MPLTVDTNRACEPLLEGYIDAPGSETTTLKRHEDLAVRHIERHPGLISGEGL